VRRSRTSWSDDVASPSDPTAEDLAVEYVLGELSPEDAATFERRVAGDPALAEEVRRLRATLGLLPFATLTAPPAHLRARAVALRGLRALPAGERYRLWARVGDRSVFCGEFAASAAGTIAAQFPVPVESYTAPIAKLFLTRESAPRGPTPAGPTVMESA